jgi:GTP cyclohydrolase IA
MNNAINKNLDLVNHQEAYAIPKMDVALTESEKIKKIQFHFRHIMEALGLDVTSDSLKDTPLRLAKMYVSEIFQGLNPESFPKISVFDNTYGYTEMLIEKDIQVYSWCEHHFLPFIGRAHVAYFPGDKVIGLSKLNRIVKYFCQKPQVQERLTIEIAESMKKHLQTEDIAVFIEAKHLCVSARGVEDTNSITITSHLRGRFNEPENKRSFYAAFENDC